MIVQRSYPVEPWCVRETSLDLTLLAQSESLFALSNGHIGLRGNLDEGEPFGIPGTYLNSFYEQRPLPYAEAGYGYPEMGQTLIDVTNGKLIRLQVDDAPFDVRYGDLHEHHRRLDLRTGMLEREVDWTSPGMTRVKVRSRRLVSFVHRSVAAIEYVVEPVAQAARIIVQSELVANERQPPLSADPRVAAVLQSPLEPVSQDSDGHSVVMLHRTRTSRLLMGAGMGHLLETPGRNAESVADLCMAMILDRLRHVSAAADAVRRGEWSFGLDEDALVPYIRFRGVELGGRTLALLGFGAVARALARRALAFGMRVVAYDPYCADEVFAEAGVARAGSLDDLLRSADVLSVHVEKTAETVGMLSAETLRLLPRGAVFVNTARAQVADQDALVAMLRDGHLAAVALDVFSPEPVPQAHPVLGEPGALVLPHIGGATVDAVRRHSAMIREDFERLARGERPLRCANPAVLDALPLR